MCHQLTAEASAPGPDFLPQNWDLFLGLIHLDIGSGQRSKVEVALVLAASAADCNRKQKRVSCVGCLGRKHNRSVC